jgi:exonuclease SbcD
VKLLHTSDWHVGKTLRGRSRAGEHEAVLAEIAEVARAEAVDAILVVGDLFDTASPTAESEAIVYRALLALAGTGAPVVVVTGNHDNERRLAAVEPLLELGQVIVRSAPARPEDGGVVELSAPSTGEQLRLALLPFVSQRGIVRAEQLMADAAADHNAQYRDRVARLIGMLTATFTADAVNVVVAHLTLANGEWGGGERQAQTIFDYWIDPGVFPASAHYVALGHLHRAQSLPGACPIWYCGSPLALDFGEAAGPKSVNVVNAAPGVPATVRTVELRSGRELRTVRGTLAELHATAEAGTTGDAYLRVFVREAGRVGLADEVRELFPDAVDVIVEAPAGDGSPAEAGPARMALAPREQFATYLSERGIDDDALLALFTELLEETSASAPA